jgi:hypothetical protein
MASSAGLMNESFFVGRTELLAWINGLLELQLSKVEAVRALWSRAAPAAPRAPRVAAASRTRRCARARCVAWRSVRRAGARGGRGAASAVAAFATPQQRCALAPPGAPRADPAPAPRSWRPARCTARSWTPFTPAWCRCTR